MNTEQVKTLGDFLSLYDELKDGNGWKLKLVDGKTVRLQSPTRPENYCYCPLTAVHRYLTGQSIPAEEYELALPSLHTRIKQSIARCADSTLEGKQRRKRIRIRGTSHITLSTLRKRLVAFGS